MVQKGSKKIPGGSQSPPIFRTYAVKPVITAMLRASLKQDVKICSLC